MTRLTLEFFHDAVCGWCFNLSPRLRALAGEFDLDIHHRTFVLQDSPAQMVAAFGSLPRARETILGHWAACRAASDDPGAFDIDGMRAAPFAYPHGLPAALACKAAERLAGREGHWRIFDALQRAHISQARNIADPEVLTAVARDCGLAPRAFAQGLADPATRRAVEADRAMARRLQVTSVPTVIVRDTGARLVNGPLEDLRAQLRACQRLVA
ncbi:DsbA family protein [Actibacterium sp. MT2.3-13A]|uniref:DsbA family oxidoreductase n=1 Tax=Actibacterium sp. MT2.3-13A TaxID=2828332 RepID=UPI001BAB6929|nr:DsbA family protein [Actibacterium sp. MT2.3-13A]